MDRTLPGPDKRPDRPELVERAHAHREGLDGVSQEAREAMTIVAGGVPPTQSSLAEDPNGVPVLPPPQIVAPLMRGIPAEYALPIQFGSQLLTGLINAGWLYLTGAQISDPNAFMLAALLQYVVYFVVTLALNLVKRYDLWGAK